VMVVDEKLRPDGRKADEIRPIWSKVGVLPRVHGTGIFTRGQTQVLTAATLGSIATNSASTGSLAIPNKRYMHYYNFPPYSVGETRPMRVPAAAKSARSPRGTRAGAILPRRTSSPTRCADQRSAGNPTVRRRWRRSAVRRSR